MSIEEAAVGDEISEHSKSCLENGFGKIYILRKGQVLKPKHANAFYAQSWSAHHIQARPGTSFKEN